ncbi:MAG: ATP-binding protein [Candidatus Zixiibacteriota bacterium]
MSDKATKPAPILLLVAFLFLLIGFWGTIRLSELPAIGAGLKQAQGQVRVVKLETAGRAERSGLKERDFILEIDRNPVRTEGDVDFYVQQKTVDDPVSLTVRRDGERLNLTVPLERKYGWLFLVVNLLAGLFVWFMGVFVFIKKPEGQVVKVFLFSSLSVSLAVLIPRAGFPFGPRQISFILPSFQIVAYTLLPALFFHFSMIFPREEPVSARSRPLIYSGYLPSLALIALMGAFYWRSVSGNSLPLFRAYSTLFLIFRIYLVLYVLLGLSVLYRTYKRSVFLEEKRKIKWIFWGIAVGTFPFIFLHTLPDVLMGRVLIPEVVKSLFVLLIPVSFAFSILKYQTMNIDVVINRSLVYSLLTGFILGIYLLVVGFLGSVLHQLTGYEGSLFPILATLAAAVLFTPAKNRIRLFVDKTFYRVRYDYRQAIQKFSREVNDAYTQDQLLDLLLRRIDQLLASKRILIILRVDESQEFAIARSIGFSEEETGELDGRRGRFLPDLLEGGQVRGSKGSIALEEFPLLPETPILKKTGITLSLPLVEKEEALGLLLIGEKKSEARYSAEDVELVSLMVQEVARSLQNARMRQRMAVEHLEKEKLEELNKLKTDFISNVSHDLRTPLTGIRFSVANMLQGVCGELSEGSRKHLLMIQESALHVSRTIDNLLTLTMSQSGRITLNREKFALDQTVDKACGMVRVLAEKKGINLVMEGLEDVFVSADRHCLLQILLNLLDNAIKYTATGGKIWVSAKVLEDERSVQLSVTDDGAGIASEELKEIFERFHKTADAGDLEKNGSGIGLDIVKNLVHLHGGEVKVESPVSGKDKGARFSFTLPQG